MDKARVIEIITSDDLASKIDSFESYEDLQAYLKDNGQDLTIEEVQEISADAAKAADAATTEELDEASLDEVTGGGVRGDWNWGKKAAKAFVKYEKKAQNWLIKQFKK